LSSLKWLDEIFFIFLKLVLAFRISAGNSHDAMNAKPKTTKAPAAKAKKATTKVTKQAKVEFAQLLANYVKETQGNFEQIEVAFNNTEEKFDAIDTRTRNLWQSIELTDKLVDTLSNATTVSARVSLAAIVLSIASIITTIVLHAH